jgi:hypothetical protein
MTNVSKVIWVDRDMKRCNADLPGARRATYVEEYDLYVIDKPKC